MHIDWLTRIILLGVNEQVTVDMWAMVPKHQIIDFGGLVQVVQHLDNAHGMRNEVYLSNDLA
jgi:hypothetical protein